jgi:hypothetical protein
MATIEGRASAEIAASIERCYEVAADLDHIAEWQGGVTRVDVLERDGQGRALVATLITEARVRTISTTVEFSHAETPRRLSWRQRKGDLKSLDGEWVFEAAGDGTTRATYGLVGDPGRILGMLVRGPVEERLREILIAARPKELKRRLEG